MTIEQDIDAFCKWVTKLGCPQNALPSEDALKSIFKSRQRDLFCNLMQRLQPRQDVQAIRENILIKKMNELRDQIVPICSRSFLPKELQTYLKIKDLQKKKEDVKVCMEECKKEYDTLSSSIKAKTIRIVDLGNKREHLQAKVDILEFKLESLNNNLEKEEQNKKKILENMPVQISTKNAKEQIALEAVKSALQELEEFYKIYNENQNATTLKEMSNDVWTKIRSIFANIPNYFLFNAIMRLKDEHLQNIINLRNSKLNDSKLQHQSGSFTNIPKEPLTQFEEKLLETKAELLGIVAQYLAARQEFISLDERFSNSYKLFVDELKKKVSLFNTNVVDEDKMDDIISDYVVQYLLREMTKLKNEYISQQIEFYKTELENGARQLENHEVLLGTIKQVYNDINASINRIQLEMLQLTQIKDKILYTKNIMQHTRMPPNTQPKQMGVPKIKINNINASMMGVESFSIGCDSVLSSTKLDFDASINPLSNTMLSRSLSNADLTLMPTVPGNINSAGVSAPPYVMELSTFVETPLQKFNCIPKECAFFILPNPLIVESTEISSTLQLAPGILLSPFGALQEVKKHINWAELIAAHSNDLKLDLELITVDPNAFKHRIKEQRERITELLDKIDVTCINTNHMLKKLSKYYDFILENPLRNYIPTTKCFSNQTYADYEAEFLMYYRMATVGASIK